MNFVRTLALVALTATTAQAADYQGTPTQADVKRAGKDLSAQTVLRADITAPVYTVSSHIEWTTEQVPQTVCTAVIGEGKGDWKGFYNAPKAEKPQRLADAIKGIGPKTAVKFVDAGYFQSKPRSWSEFQNVILSADRALGTGIAHEVLVTYGTENMTNLGYYSSDVCHIEYVSQLVATEVQDKTLYANVTRHYTLIVNNAPLLSMEAETISVTFDGFADSLSVSSSYNSYTNTRSENGGNVTYVLNGTRQRVCPPASLQAYLSNDNGRLVINALDQAYDASLGADAGQPTIVADIFQKRALWFPQKLASVQTPLSTGTASTTLPTGLFPAHGKKVYVRYSLKRLNSKFYSNDACETKDTDTLTF